MSAHTPGPWTVGKAVLRNAVAEISASRGEQTWTIAHVAEVDGGDKDAANARLIAAAPELLEALLALRTHEEPDCWCPPGHKHGRRILDHEHTDQCVMTRAALAKAEGKPCA